MGSRSSGSESDFLFRCLFGGKTYFYRDVAFFEYPLKKLVTEAYANGEWPLWNPYIQLGQPLLANPNANAFYPTQPLFHILPFELAFNLHAVVHCLVAGIATFYLCRTLRLTGFAAFVAALTYNFSGITISLVNLYILLPFVALFPLLTLSFLKIQQRPSLLENAFWNQFVVWLLFPVAGAPLFFGLGDIPDFLSGRVLFLFWGVTRLLVASDLLVCRRRSFRSVVGLRADPADP